MISARYCGFGLSLLSSILISFATTLVSYLKEFHPLSKSFWRFLAAAILASSLVLYFTLIRKKNLTNAFWPLTKRSNLTNFVLILVRSLFSVTAIILQYYSLKYMSLADSSTVSYSTPIFVMIIAYVFLREPFGYFSFFTTIIAMLGVVLITRPPFLTGGEVDIELIIGVSFAFSSTISRGISIVLIRYLKEVHQSVILFTFGLWGSIQAFILAYFTDHFQIPKEHRHIAFMTTIGFCSAFGQLFLILALKCENAGPVSLIRTCDIIFAFMFDMAFNGVYPDIYSILGGLIILFGVLMIGLKKYIEELDTKHPLRKYLWFVLK